MNGKSEYGSGRPIAVRLTRGKDLRQELLALCGHERILAGTIASLVGSLDVAALRFAGQDQVKILPGPFEIVSATGTCGGAGVHVHVALADATGQLIGGHLGEGSIVATTVEMVVLDMSAWFSFQREHDADTQAKELRVQNVSNGF